ncbi:DUF1493 family protein [Defluviimonas sp. WL0024]|uniref:DUF1493 family protein n=1 Tax=Albidovulum salinarum TaxID=2984153 RepID=A0ABT2X2Z4_9RHOB|nr:DUF1493 family protein [Defluviimonas sp. WL0024]MCU9848288.1 DUF1493 family protein [Defluviimonas sp. WL0024]
MAAPGRRDVAAFVEEQLGRRLDPVAEADILAATGCDGDDAFAFLEAFATRFGTDLSGYRWEFHHADEGSLFAPGWPFRPPDRRVARIPISLDLLTEAAQRQIWPLSYPPHRPDRRRFDRFNLSIAVALVIAVILVLARIAE